MPLNALRGRTRRIDVMACHLITCSSPFQVLVRRGGLVGQKVASLVVRKMKLQLWSAQWERLHAEDILMRCDV